MYSATWPYKGVSRSYAPSIGRKLGSFTLLHASRIRGEEEGGIGRPKEDGSASPRHAANSLHPLPVSQEGMSPPRERGDPRYLRNRSPPRDDYLSFPTVPSRKCLLTIRAGGWDNEKIISEICVSRSRNIKRYSTD